ncbi:MAG: hypothetical protein GXP31_01405 [Kiritimatiellaeota bacterium]|nr:hypothetical protein [Kiritimatiellota bacterium]
MVSWFTRTASCPPRRFFGARFLFLVCLPLLLGGCHSGPETEIAQLVVRSGADQCGLPGGECPKPLVVEVLGPRRRGLLGGKGWAHPVPQVRVRFAPADPADGLEVVGDSEVLTNAAGMVRVTVRLGKKFGDQYLKITLPDVPGLSRTVRFISGIQVSGNKQEALAGDVLHTPITVTVADENGDPLQGVPVYFTLVHAPGKKGELEVLQPVTDAEGNAFTQLRTDPHATGKYEILAEVSDPTRKIWTRGVRLTALALNRTQLMIGLLGGLGIFILGMKFMSDGLQQVAGPRLKSLLQMFTRNRVAGVAAGTVVTGLIQSSSACTVMVVGFVNAGLLSLRQAIGVIYGANIGTTVTAQMVSFKLDAVAFPAITLGVALSLLAKRHTTRHLAEVLFGFGLLFFGMKLMSTQMKGVAGFPTFVHFFSLFDCRPSVPGGLMPLPAVLGAIVIGAAMTTIVQSSSAVTGLIIALATSGLLNFWTAVPLTLGSNIGTTITALLASIGTNARARQSAIAHLLFNVLGTVYMVALFYVTVDGIPVFMYLVDQITAGAVFADIPENVGRHVASAHTLFNVFNAVLFLPLVAPVAWLCEHVVPVKDRESLAIHTLEPHLLDAPAVALQQSVRTASTMLETAWQQVKSGYEAVREREPASQADFVEREEQIDKLQHDITQYLVELTARELSEQQSRVIPDLIHCVNDIERIGDHATNLMELARQAADNRIKFSKKAREELDGLFKLVKRMARSTRAALQAGATEATAEALKIEGEVNRLRDVFEHNHVRRLEKGKCSVVSGVVYVDVVGNLERIADHLSNIAERAPAIHSHGDGVSMIDT